MRLTIDFETRSRIDLRKVGAYRYSCDPTTQVICLAIKIEDNEPLIWCPMHEVEDPRRVSLDRVASELEDCNIIEAHNVYFEMCIWENVLRRDNPHVPSLPFNKLRCSSAKCSSVGLPAKLEDACKALNLSVQKDMEGHRLMMRMCKPCKVTKKNPTGWVEDYDSVKRLCEYCTQDVEAEHYLSMQIHDLSDDELGVFRDTLEVNNEGIPVDLEGVDALIAIDEARRRYLNDSIYKITNGVIKSCSVRGQILKYLESMGIYLPNMQKDTIDKAVEDESIKGQALELINVYREGSKTSTAKLEAMKRMARNSRVCGSLMYHGAGTGRWAGRGLQPHNMPRTKLKDEAIEEALVYADMGYSIFSGIYGDTVGKVSKMVRGMICARPGHTLYCADFSSIEGRVLAWLAGEEHVLQGYREDKDMYKIAASSIFNKLYEDIDDKERSIGKVAELACGYQGAYGAYVTMEAGYGFDTYDEIGEVTVERHRQKLLRKTQGSEPTREQVKESVISELVRKWRSNRPKTVRFWHDIEDCVIDAIHHPGEIIKANRGIKIIYRNGSTPEDFGGGKLGIGSLRVMLPSGRVMYYVNPSIKKVYKFGELRDVIHYWGVDPTARKWKEIQTYGGKLTENIVQAIARDLLAYVIRRLCKDEYPVSFHVHDEVVAHLHKEDIVEGKYSFEEFMRYVKSKPEWAVGIPMDADGWHGKRYRK